MTEYRERTYRKRVNARDLILNQRHQLESYIDSHPEFMTTLKPYPKDPYAPPMVKEMIETTGALGVGPMSSVAGAIAQYVGHSLSLGSADIVCIISPSAVLADGAATALGNRIRDTKDLEKIADWADEMEGISGVLVIVKDKVAAWGEVELVKI